VRTGALITRNKEVYHTVLKFGQARLSPPSLGQIAGEAAVDTPDLYFKEVYQEYINRRNFVIGALNKIDGVFAPMPKGAFYTVIKLPVNDAEHFCQWLLEEFDYQNETVMLAPANGFYTTEGLGKDEARIAYVLNVEDLKKAVKCLEEALKVYPGRKKIDKHN
jgi:aspartate aminotransferase